MIARQSSIDTQMGVSFIASAIVHLAVFLLLFWWSQLFPTTLVREETYYVDVVNLPVADPRSGSSTQKGDDREAPPPPPPPPAPEQQMALPTPKNKAPQVKAKPADKPGDSSFAERMARLENKAEARQQESRFEQLRRQTTGTGRSGMATGKGTEAGSDYAAFIQSRLKDAFRETISYTSSRPEILVRLIIDTDGKVTRRKIEKSSGDQAFELAVLRAIDMASEKFTPPPSRKIYEGMFVFKPQGISERKP